MKKYDTRRLVTLAMLAAIAYAAVAFIRIPAVQFLKYEPKDVVLAITGLLFGPLEPYTVEGYKLAFSNVKLSTSIISTLVNGIAERPRSIRSTMPLAAR